MSIPTFVPQADRPDPEPPSIVIQLAVTEDDATRRAGIVLTGSRGVLDVDGEQTGFRSSQVWQVVRDLLPELGHLRHDPAAQSGHRPQPADLVPEECSAVVTMATAVRGDDEVSLRTWLVADDDVYAVEPRGPVTTAPGAVASALVWDVTGAMERLVRNLEAAS